MSESITEADTYFKYAPFNPGVPGIRLLTILPDDLQDPLRCTLTHYHWELETGQGGIQGKFLLYFLLHEIGH
jgi:hypothetical protein